MNEHVFDALSRRTVGITRRGSLTTLGGAGLAALVGLSTAEAGKKSKKNKKKSDKKCQRQVGQCTGYFAPLCEGEGAPVDCTAEIGECCEYLGECQASEFIQCLMTLMRRPLPENP